MSPYLFLLCSERFSNLLRKAEQSKKITGISVSRGGLRISHLFFADDSLIFCKADKDQANQLMNILEVYGKGSGQVINLEKSAVFFSKNLQRECKVEIAQCLGNIQEAQQGKYLALPMVVTRSREQVFGFIKDSLRSRINNWKNKFLS